MFYFHVTLKGFKYKPKRLAKNLAIVRPCANLKSSTTVRMGTNGVAENISSNIKTIICDTRYKILYTY